MIAYVEDDVHYGELIRDAIGRAGHVCRVFQNANSLRVGIRDATFSLFILDRSLPDVSGDELITWIRQTVGARVPILILTNSTSEDFVISALASGADDYLVKSSRMGELIARIKALLRRSDNNQKGSSLLTVGKYTLDWDQKIACLNGEDAGLAPREFGVAYCLFKNIGKLVTRASIELSVWGRVIGADSRTLDTHVSKVRTKLALSPANGVRLVNVYSQGFRLLDLGDISPD